MKTTHTHTHSLSLSLARSLFSLPPHLQLRYKLVVDLLVHEEAVCTHARLSGVAELWIEEECMNDRVDDGDNASLPLLPHTLEAIAPTTAASMFASSNTIKGALPP